MNGNDIAMLENPNLVGEGLKFDGALPGCGHAVGITANADYALPGDTAFQGQNGAGGRVGREIAGWGA
nr:hypothetical protein [Ancylobacter aquaticus]